MANPPNASLPISNIVQVSVLGAGPSVAVPNMSALAIVTQAAAPGGWSGGQTYGQYADPVSVALDWGSGSDVANMAEAVFAQQPNILTGGGTLVIIPRLQVPSLESIQACVTRMQNVIFFEGFLCDLEFAESSTATFLALATFTQSVKKFFLYCSSQISELLPGSPFDQVRAAGQTFTRCFYYGGALANAQTQIFSAAYASRAMSVDWEGDKTAGSMQLATLTGITPDQTITETAYNEALAAAVDIYPAFGGDPSVSSSGANLFWDQAYGRAWLAFQLQVNGFNYLKALADLGLKVPQTEQGILGLQKAYQEALDQAVANGYAAPGTWTLGTTFGNPATLRSNVEQLGYYIFHAPLKDQPPADRKARKAPPFQIALQEAGAVNQTSVVVYVNA